MRIVAIWMVFLLAGLAVSAAKAQQISIDPAKIELNLEKRLTSGKLEVKNLGDRSIRYRVSAVHWILDRSSRLKIIPADSMSMVSWIKFNPREFELKAQSTQVVRYTIIKPNRPLNGEYWAAIQFEPLEYQVYNVSDSAADTAKRAMIKVINAVMIPVYAEIGKVERKGDIQEFRIYQQDELDIFTVVIANQGNGLLRLKGEYTLRSLSNGQVSTGGKVGPIFVFPGQAVESRIPLSMKLKPGSYALRISLSDLKSDVTLNAEGELDIGGTPNGGDPSR